MQRSTVHEAYHQQEHKADACRGAQFMKPITNKNTRQMLAEEHSSWSLSPTRTQGRCLQRSTVHEAYHQQEHKADACRGAQFMKPITNKNTRQMLAEEHSSWSLSATRTQGRCLQRSTVHEAYQQQEHKVDACRGAQFMKPISNKNTR